MGKMVDCKEFYYNKDNTWTIVYKDGTKSVVQKLPIDFTYIGISRFMCFVHGAEYIESCRWSFEDDGALCPILYNISHFPQDNKWGFINSVFQIVVAPQFDYESGVKTTYQDIGNGAFIPDQTTYGLYWKDGKCTVLLNNKKIVINESDYINIFIEQNTNYAYRIQHMDNPSFEKVRGLSVEFYRSLPQELQDELFDALNRGVDVADSEPQMTAYMFSYGKMHQSKLNYAFSKLSDDFLLLDEINIIDYGCGQALGTMCYADYLRDNGYTQQVKTITLIEPSEICLKRAALHASVFFSDAVIKTVNKKFDDLSKDDIICDEEIPTLHILSNVLDMLSFDLESFSDLVKRCLKGFNHFVCVGPYFGLSEKDQRIQSFANRINSEIIYSHIFNKYELDASNSWTAQINCFSVGKLVENLSTEVTEEDIAIGIEDEYGVLYSRDGKRVLKDNYKYLNDGFWNHYRWEPDSVGCDLFLYLNHRDYNIKQGTIVICDEAFSAFFDKYNGYYYSGLQSVIIPETVRMIGNSAFQGCVALKEVFIPDSVVYLGNNAFRECYSLQQVRIPNSIKEIGNEAFYGCSLLQQITLPATIDFIGKDAFYNCMSLKQIIIPKGKTKHFKELLDNWLWDKLVEE